MTPKQIIASNAEVLEVVLSESAGGDEAFADAVIAMLIENGYVIAGKSHMARLARLAEAIDDGEDGEVDGAVRQLREIFPEYEWTHHEKIAGDYCRRVSAVPKSEIVK